MFHRYRPVFRGRWPMIIASAVAFGYAHVVFDSALAVGLSSVGGGLFALTYDRTRSTLICAIEHTLYGCFIFTVGLGVHFYAGTMRFAESAAGAAGW
jgi:membrane protease YdiL (CAAX protease family)